MKKLLGILVLGLLWLTDAFALSQQSAIDQYLSERKLESIEGIWIASKGRVFVIFKSANKYYCKVIRSGELQTGSTFCEMTKGSENLYYGEEYESAGTFDLTITINGNTASRLMTLKGQSFTWYDNRVWPTDLVAHNEKYKTKKDIADEEKVVADMVADAKKTCKVLGFEEESEKFADCTLKLYTKKVDELVAKKVEASTRMMQSQTTTQSSGSNTMTIYDPVRDNQRMMNQGMKMLSGGCTLGIDC